MNITRPAHAYTLVELAIVLGILSAFAMLSWPVLMKPWQRSEAQQAAEGIREALGEARIAAMTEGHVYQFRWKANTGEYEVRSREPLPKASRQFDRETVPGLTTPAESNSSMESMPTRQQALEMLMQDSGPQAMEHKRLFHQRLPLENVFFDARAIETAFFHDDVDAAGNRKQWNPQGNGQPDDELRQRRDRMQAWKAVNFYPDGRSDNQRFTIRSFSGYEVEVELRGFTGSVTVSQPRRVQRQKIDLNHIDALDMSNLTNEITPTSDDRPNGETDG